ncbi:MAG: OadG family protein [Clostridia bacterium]|nr:OadG family protein [Clostridia bacterium]
MLYNLLVSGADPFRKVDGWEASLYALIGFAVVFVGILFLILIVWATGKLISVFDGKGKKAKNKKNKKVKDEAVTPSENSSTNVESEEIDEETVAIITAAIMAYYQKNNPKCEFTVKRIKRI